MNTTEILQKTEKLVNDSRAKTHGDKIKNHENSFKQKFIKD